MAKWPLYPVSVVGSWPRPARLLEARRRKRREAAALADVATVQAIRCQEEAGVDIISDGEQRRDDFYSFLCERLEGLRLMTMAELLDYVEDKAAFENLLRALDVPAFAIRNPTVVGPLRLRAPLVMDDFHFLRAHTDKPVKVTLPGPYLLSRSSWVKSLSEGAYPTRRALADDIVAILRSELEALAAAGADVVQLDEPVLTELVFAGKSATRTFMCAALAAEASPEGELEFAVELINRVVGGIRGPVRALHVCRGNWSKNEGVLLEGPYDALMPHLARLDIDQFVLEYATPRAGSLEALQQLPKNAQVGFGAVNPRTDVIESPEQVAERVRFLTRFLEPERIWLNPDCGFGTFAERPVATSEIAVAKLKALAAARDLLTRGKTPGLSA